MIKLVVLTSYPANPELPQGGVESVSVNLVKALSDTGELKIEPAQLIDDLQALDAAGFTVKIHTAGDRALRITLDAIEAARKANGMNDLRHELAHASYINAADYARFKGLNAIAEPLLG